MSSWQREKDGDDDAAVSPVGVAPSPDGSRASSLSEFAEHTVGMAEDHYKALEVPRDASPDAIKDAWRRIAKASHPDRNPGDEAAVDRFVRAREAYKVLADPTRRRLHDLALQAPLHVSRATNYDGDIFTPRRAPRRAPRRTVHAPPPSDRDVRAVRYGDPSDGSALIIGFGVIGIGPIALIFAIVIASFTGPLPCLAGAGALALFAVIRLRDQPEARAVALATAVALVLGAGFAQAQIAGVWATP